MTTESIYFNNRFTGQPCTRVAITCDLLDRWQEDFKLTDAKGRKVGACLYIRRRTIKPDASADGVYKGQDLPAEGRVEYGYDLQPQRNGKHFASHTATKWFTTEAEARAKGNKAMLGSKKRYTAKFG